MITKLFTITAIVALATAAPVTTGSGIVSKRDPANELIAYYVDGSSDVDKKRDVMMRRDPENELVAFYIPKGEMERKEDMRRRDPENELVSFYIPPKSEVKRRKENGMQVYSAAEEKTEDMRGRDSEN